MSQTIMILGGGVMQLPAIRTASRAGWKVCVADGNSACPGSSLADEFFPVDLKDLEGLVDAARSVEPAITGVFTAGTDFSASVAFVAEALGLPGTSYESSLNASDKIRMRKLFEDQGVPSPAYREISSEAKIEQTIAGLSFPLVVKPVDNMGARGVRRVDDPEDLISAIHDAMGYSRSHRAVVEELIDGKEYSIDALVNNGEITICGLAERHIYFPPTFVEMGHTIPADIPEEVQRDLIDVFRAGVRALGITRGAAKGDVFHTRSGAVVGEIAARLSGGYMSGWTYPYASGHNVTESALNLSVGLPPGDLSPRRNWYSAERAFLSIPGIVAQVVGVSAARSVPGVKDVFLRIKTGQSVKFPSNNVEKCGNIIATAQNRENAIRAAQYALRCIEIHLEPNEPDTDAFLFQPRSVPSSASILEISLPADISAYGALEESGTALDTVSTLLDAGNGRGVTLPGIVALPQWNDERTANWMGMSLSDGVRAACRRYGLKLDDSTGSGAGSFGARFSHASAASRAFSTLFWLSLVRGGLQGVDYLVDSLSARAPLGIRVNEGLVEV